MKDYAHHFNPNLQLADLDHALLARYGRDIMLANHIHDRSALSQVSIQFGSEAQTQIACDEWMSSSPIYNARNRRFLKISGDDVGAALKGFQFDIGAPHNYLNFHYDLVSPEEGYFWTSTCGPFNYVHEVSGGDVNMQTQICHHMEDPTFDATVMAVNPRMRCTPVFRPPVAEIPEHGPCKWLVSIQRDVGLVEDCPFLEKTQATLAANFEFPLLPPGGHGLQDYSGAFKRDMCLEDLSHNTLSTMCKEFMLDVLLLNYACYGAVADRFGEEHVTRMQQDQYHHLAPVTVHRLRNTFGIQGDDMASILKVLQLNPFVPWDYFVLGYQLLSETRGLVWLTDCAGYREPVKRGIASLMITDPANPGFDKLAKEVNPVALIKPMPVEELENDVEAVLAWEILIDPTAPVAPRSDFADIVGQHMWGLDNSRHNYNYQWYDNQVAS